MSKPTLHLHGTCDRVIVTDREHPHYGETGVFTGEVVTFKHWEGRMALVKLDACRHGTDSCYVSPGQIARVP